VRNLRFEFIAETQRRQDAEKSPPMDTDSHRWAEPQIDADGRRFNFFPPEDSGDFIKVSDAAVHAVSLRAFQRGYSR